MTPTAYACPAAPSECRCCIYLALVHTLASEQNRHHHSLRPSTTAAFPKSSSLVLPCLLVLWAGPTFSLSPRGWRKMRCFFWAGHWVYLYKNDTSLFGNSYWCSLDLSCSRSEVGVDRLLQKPIAPVGCVPAGHKISSQWIRNVWKRGSRSSRRQRRWKRK